MLMAKAVTELANRTPGKEAMAMESFAKALAMVRGRLGSGAASALLWSGASSLSAGDSSLLH